MKILNAIVMATFFTCALAMECGEFDGMSIEELSLIEGGYIAGYDYELAARLECVEYCYHEVGLEKSTSLATIVPYDYKRENIVEMYENIRQYNPCQYWDFLTFFLYLIRIRKQYPCTQEFCLSAFKTLRDRMYHCCESHPDCGFDYECSCCNVKIREHSEFECHIKNHIKQVPPRYNLRCLVCGKLFITYDSCEAHLQSNGCKRG